MPVLKHYDPNLGQWVPVAIVAPSPAAGVPVLDTANQFTGTNVETVLAEIQDNVDALVISGGGMAVASEAEALAGTNNTKAMTPARAKRVAPFLSAEAFGAVGDGVTDDTAALQAWIDAGVDVARAAGTPLWLPPGIYRITSTLVWPEQSGGGRCMGGGMLLNDYHTNLGGGSQTIIVWDGADGGTMIEQAGNVGWEFSHISFVGRDAAAAANRAGIGFLCGYTPGYASGVMTFRHCFFNDMDVGVQFAELVADGNCADVTFETCGWQATDTGVYVLNTQGLNYRFASPSVVYVPCWLRFAAGGTVHVTMLNTAGCGGTGAGDWVMDFGGISGGAAYVHVDSWRAEQGTKQLVRATGMGSIVIDGLDEAQTDQAHPMFAVTGPELKIRDSHLMTHDATTPAIGVAWSTSSERSGLWCENVHFDAAEFVFDEWVGLDTNDSVVINLRGCRYGDLGLRLQDLNSHLEHGPVTHYGTTTDGNAAFVSLRGSAVYNWSTIAIIPTDSTWLIDAYVIGQEVGGGGDTGAFHRRFVYKNAAGVSSIVGSVQTIGTDQNSDAWGGVGATIEQSYDAVFLTVTGKAATTINWTAQMVGTRVDV